jgi:hypothetical protein
LKTDHIDIIQLHSPSYEDLASGDGLEGLKRAQEQGKVRFVSISADGDVARKAIEMGEFDTLQITYNVLRQESADIISAAREKDMGIIVKEPIAQAIFAKPRPENGNELWDRGQTLLANEVLGDLSQFDVALRWLLSVPNVQTAIVGTTNLDHFESNVRAVEQGRLPNDMLAEIEKRFTQATANSSS